VGLTVDLCLCNDYINITQAKERTMKTFTIEISEEQLRLIRATCLFTINHNGDLTEEESEEIDIIADMILDTVEGDHEEDTIHGFCY
jgi:hypothetical protein